MNGARRSFAWAMLAASLTGCASLLGVDGDFGVAPSDGGASDANLLADAAGIDASVPDSSPDAAPLDSGRACNDAQPAANEITVTTSATFPFKASYAPVFLGAVPGGKKLGACAAEGDSLVVAYDVGTATASLQRIPLVRTCDGAHVSSIGAPVKVADAPGIDLGFLSNPYAYVPTRAASAEPFAYFECANGACAKSFDFTTGDPAATSLSLAPLPDVFNAVKVRAYATPSANVYSLDKVSKTLTKIDTLTSFPVTQPVAVSAGSPVFGARYAIGPIEGVNKISFFQVDNEGGLLRPSAGLATTFATTTIPLRGACQDPATGDMIFTASDGSGRIDTIKGFAKP